MSQRPRAACVWAGCTTQRGRRTAYCSEHVIIAKACIYDDCDKRVAAWNIHALCPEHRWLAMK